MTTDGYSNGFCVFLEQLDRVTPTPFTVNMSTIRRVKTEALLVFFQRDHPNFLLPSNRVAPNNNNRNIVTFLNINKNVTTFFVYLIYVVCF